MAEFTFNGKILKNRSGQKMGEIDRTFIRAWNSSKLGEIDRKNIRNAQSKKVAEFDGKVVKDDLGNQLATHPGYPEAHRGPGRNAPRGHVVLLRQEIATGLDRRAPHRYTPHP